LLTFVVATRTHTPKMTIIPLCHFLCCRATFRHELRTQPHVTTTDPNPPASKGCRGEITRNPKEVSETRWHSNRRSCQ
jgi:hypothetical protein